MTRDRDDRVGITGSVGFSVAAEERAPIRVSRVSENPERPGSAAPLRLSAYVMVACAQQRQKWSKPADPTHRAAPGSRPFSESRAKPSAERVKLLCRREWAARLQGALALKQASLLGAAGTVGAAPNVAQSSTHGPTAAERLRLGHLAADFMDFYGLPGLSVAVGSRGAPVYVEAFGLADKESQEALTTDHRFRIASVTKPITSAGVLLLMEAGKLRRGDHVFGPNSILGEEFPTPAGRQAIEAITVDHLLTHTAGG